MIRESETVELRTTELSSTTKLHSTIVNMVSTRLTSSSVKSVVSNNTSSTTKHIASTRSPSSPLRRMSLEKLPNILVLVYTSNGGQVRWVGENRDECILDQIYKKQCPLEKFEVTYDKTRFIESDLVIFHSNNMPSVQQLDELSKKRPISQRWAYHTMESPKVTPDPGPLKGLFNATWTYRSDSEFSAAYATYYPLNNVERLKVTTRDYSQEKSKLVAWMVSNCGAQLRNKFVQQLKQYINVDVYGSCSSQFGKHQSCSKSNEKHCLKEYKFYLAFENALCKDYITEKYWERLGEENVVPVVMGGADRTDYKRLAIPGSFINVMDFKTVKELADYLHYLDRNNTAYNEYFKWRRIYKISPYHYPLCNFCKSYVLKPELSETKVYNLKDFWVEKAMCNKNEYLVRDMWTT